MENDDAARRKILAAAMKEQEIVNRLRQERASRRTKDGGVHLGKGILRSGTQRERAKEDMLLSEYDEAEKYGMSIEEYRKAMRK